MARRFGRRDRTARRLSSAAAELGVVIRLGDNSWQPHMSTKKPSLTWRGGCSRGLPSTKLCGDNTAMQARIQALLAVHYKQPEFVEAEPTGVRGTVDSPATDKVVWSSALTADRAPS